MKRMKLASLSSDELWALHQEVAATLASRLTAEMRTIENRLRQTRLACPDQAASENDWSPILSNSYPKIPESGPAVANLGRSGKATALAERAPEFREADRRS
jgi:hypothetical protein